MQSFQRLATIKKQSIAIDSQSFVTSVDGQSKTISRKIRPQTAQKLPKVVETGNVDLESQEENSTVLGKTVNSWCKSGFRDSFTQEKTKFNNDDVKGTDRQVVLMRNNSNDSIKENVRNSIQDMQSVVLSNVSNENDEKSQRNTKMTQDDLLKSSKQLCPEQIVQAQNVLTIAI